MDWLKTACRLCRIGDSASARDRQRYWSPDGYWKKCSERAKSSYHSTQIVAENGAGHSRLLTIVYRSPAALQYLTK